jgi:hypothetical protein
LSFVSFVVNALPRDVRAALRRYRACVPAAPCRHGVQLPAAMF